MKSNIKLNFKTQLKLIGTCLAASLISFNSMAANTKGFQVAVVELTPGAKEIIEGQYQTGLKKLTLQKTAKRPSFNRSLTLCAANIMVNDFQSADGACTVAIEKYKNRNGMNHKYLRSIAYSNRGIARYLQGDKEGASTDLRTAASIDRNRIVMANLAKIKRKSNID